MKTLSEAASLADYLGSSVVVGLRGGAQHVIGVIRQVHEDDDEVTVEIPSMGASHDFKTHEVWPGVNAWIAFRGRTPTKVFMAPEDTQLIEGDEGCTQFECFAADSEGILHSAVLRLRVQSVDYILVNSGEGA